MVLRLAGNEDGLRATTKLIEAGGNPAPVHESGWAFVLQRKAGLGPKPISIHPNIEWRGCY